MNEMMTEIPSSSYYYSNKFGTSGQFYNINYAINFAIEDHWKKLLFPEGEDTRRIIYGGNDFAFRRNARMNQGVLNIPFMNYYCKQATPDTHRFTWNNTATFKGLSSDFTDKDGVSYASILGTKLLIVPTHFVYEATVWYSQPQDLLYAYHQSALDNTNETILWGEVSGPNNTTIKIPAIQYLNLDMNPEMTENDWFEKNKIVSLALDFEFDSWLIYPASDAEVLNPEIFGFTEEVILKFINNKKISMTEITNGNSMDTIISYFNPKKP